MKKASPFYTRYGYEDADGKLIIPQRFAEAKEFSFGLAAVKEVGSDKWGYISEDGTYAIPPQYDEVYDFHHTARLASVRIGEQWGIINTRGEMVIPLQDYHLWLNPGDAELVVFAKEKDGLWGLMDTKGNILMEPRYRWIDFIFKTSVLICVANYTADGSYKEGLIDNHFREVMPCILDREPEWKDDRWMLAICNDKYGFIGEDGHWALAPQYYDIEAFDPESNLAPVCWSHRQWGLIDRQGQVVMKPRFDRLGTPSCGLVYAEQGRKCGFVDFEGHWVVQAPRDMHGKKNWRRFDRFSEGLSATRTQYGVGYIDRTGRFAIAPRFRNAKAFKGGMAAVETKSGWGIIEKEGQFIMEPTHGSIYMYGPNSDGSVRVDLDTKTFDVKDGQWTERLQESPQLYKKTFFGLGDSEGNPRTEAIYTGYHGLDPNTGNPIVQKDGQWYMLDSEGNHIPHPKEEQRRRARQ